MYISIVISSPSYNIILNCIVCMVGEGFVDFAAVAVVAAVAAAVIVDHI